MHVFRLVSHQTLSQVAVITGANTGIGREVARDFYQRGCAVLILCRNVEKGEQARADIEECAENGPEGLMSPERGSIFVLKCDLASLESVRGCAEALNRKWNRIDLLVNNAGRLEEAFARLGGNYTHFLPCVFRRDVLPADQDD